MAVAVRRSGNKDGGSVAANQAATAAFMQVLKSAEIAPRR